nr:uncharacterized mitochondrial protein AtMg00810-like [Tanacetum cinerariifolium]
MSAMGELNFFLGLQVLQKEDGIFLSQDKYVGDILKKFRYSDVRSSNTPMDKENPWGKDRTGKDVDLHIYRFMIGSLMYLTASRPDIIFTVCACARHQVTPKECHLLAVKRIFRYLKGHPKLGLWYPKESPFDLVAYSDTDYGCATQDRKSTTGGCQFLGRRLISWQCKKQTIVATSTTKAEYVAAANLLTKPFDAGRFQYLVCKLFPLLGKLSTVGVFLCFGLTFKGTSKYWGVLRILMISLGLIPLFCDYHNMVAILEKSEHNVDFHPIVDFVEASPLRIEKMKEGTKILATVDGILRTVTESSLRRNLKLQDEEGINSLPDAELFENLTLMGYYISPNEKFTFQKVQFSHQWKYLIHTIIRSRIAQSSALPPVADEPASPLRDVSQGEACPTDSGFGTDQDRANIAKISTLPYDSAPRVTSPVADEGRAGNQHVKATVLASGVAEVLTGSGSIPTAGPPAAEVPTGSDVVPTDGLIFVTATVVTPYTRRKGKETMAESETPKKKKVQEQIYAQLARELEEKMARKDQRMSEQVARDAEIARIHAEEELQIMIDGLDRSNETVAKYLQEYHQFASELPLERRIQLINDLVRYQDSYAKVHKYQSQQRKPWSKKQKRDYYMAVIKSNLGWKVKDFRGMIFKEIEAKLKALQVKHPIIDWKVHTEGHISYWKVTRLGGSSTSYQFFVDMLKHLDREDLNQLWALVKESLSIRPPTNDKEMELLVELKRLYEPDDEDQLWTHT